MERVPRPKYTKEFREQAVQLVLEQELTTPKAARRLAISDKTLACPNIVPRTIKRSGGGLA